MTMRAAGMPNCTDLRGLLRKAARATAAVLLAVFAAVAYAQDDLPSRVGRLADLGGEVYHAPEDRASDWEAIGVNYPVTSGDNLWVAEGSRAEIDVGAGQIRLGPQTNLHVARLDDRVVSLFLAQGQLSVRLRFLDPGEAAHIDTPNTQVVLTRTGLYRVEVSGDRNRTVVVVREGEATLPTSAGMQQVLPGQTAVAQGLDATRVDVANGIVSDGFDAWVAERDRRYARSRSSPYVSRQMVGAADLDAYGAWETDTTYGSVWYPTQVAAGWAPYRDGRWTWVAPWGWTWVDAAPWGYAPFHYGRWVVVGGRWGWCPGAFVARPIWAPAMVGWIGGSGWSVSVSWGAPVMGWVPLAWGEPFRPWWNGCSSRCWSGYNRPYAAHYDERVRRAPPQSYINASRPGGVTAIPVANFASERSVSRHLVPVTAAQVRSAPDLAYAPPAERPAPGRPTLKPRLSDAPPAASTFAPGSGMARGSPSRSAGESVKPSIGAPSRGTSAAPTAPSASYSAPDRGGAPSVYTTPVQRETAKPYAPATAPSRQNVPSTGYPQPDVSPPARQASPAAATYSPSATGPARSSSPQRPSMPVASPSNPYAPPSRSAPQPKPAVVSPPPASPQAEPRGGATMAPVPPPQMHGQAPAHAPAAKPSSNGSERKPQERGGHDGSAPSRGNASEKPGGMQR